MSSRALKKHWPRVKETHYSANPFKSRGISTGLKESGGKESNLHTHTHTRKLTHPLPRTHIHLQTHTNSHIYLHTHTHTHTHTCTDRFRAAHQAAIMKIWLTFQNQEGCRVERVLQAAVWPASSALSDNICQFLPKCSVTVLRNLSTTV